MDSLAPTSIDAGLPDIEGIFTQGFAFVWANLRRLGVAPADLDDATQEVFVVVHRRRSALESVPLRAWLYGIVRRIAARYRRGDQRRERLTSAVALAHGGDASFEDDAITREAIAMVDDFLARLDDDKREVFVLAEIEQLSGKEIATALGIPADTVWSRLRAAREQFERHFARVRAEMQRASGSNTPLARRQALALSRRSHTPPADARRRVAAVLAVRLASPDVIAPLSWWGSWWARPFAPEMWIVAGTVAVGGVALVGVRSALDEPRAAATIATDDHDEASARAIVVPEPIVAEGLPPLPAPAPAPAATPDRPPSSSPSAITRTPQGEPAPTSALADELALLERARRASDPAATLALAESYARTYPNGTLAPDGLAIRIAALCELGRDADATALARALARTQPGAPWAKGCPEKTSTKPAGTGDENG